MACLPAVINQHQVCLEFIKPRTAQVQGLSGRTNIPESYGLIFDTGSLGKNETVFFTMTKMNVPIDMIFVKNKKIVLIEYNAQPCDYKPNKCLIYGGFATDYVIETKAGNANKWGLAMFQSFNIENNHVKK